MIVNETAKTTIRWQAYEREHTERESSWYIALGITAVAIAIISIMLHDPLFAVLIIAGAVALGLVNRHPPILSTFELSERGVRINNIIHHYDDIVAFWVLDATEHHPHSKLLLETRTFTAPNIIISLQNIDPASIRAYLHERAKEAPMREPVAHKIIEFLGF